MGRQRAQRSRTARGRTAPGTPRPHSTGDATATPEYAAALETVTTRLLASLDEHETVARAAVADLVAQLAVHADALASTYPSIAAGSPGPRTPGRPDQPGWHAPQRGRPRAPGRTGRPVPDPAQGPPHGRDRRRTAPESRMADRGRTPDGRKSSRSPHRPSDPRAARTRQRAAAATVRRTAGFADNFDIVNLASHNRRSSRTLSGGAAQTALAWRGDGRRCATSEVMRGPSGIRAREAWKVSQAPGWSGRSERRHHRKRTVGRPSRNLSPRTLLARSMHVMCTRYVRFMVKVRVEVCPV